jgi:hypothetical protein
VADPTYGTIDPAYGLRLATTPAQDDGPVWMVNLMSYRERADYGDAGDRGLTGREADDRYAPVDVLSEIGAEVTYYADVERQFLADDPRWDRVGIVRYPTRRSFIDMQSRRDFTERHEHKAAGMAATIIMGCVPMPSPGLPDGMEEVPWDAVPHPPTADDGPVVVVHVLQFADGPDQAPDPSVTPEEMQAYTRAATAPAVAHGVRVRGWFAVEGTIVGDGRAWHQVRFHEFPSARAFMAVALDPDRLAAQRAHREPALSATYTLLTRPVLPYRG